MHPPEMITVRSPHAGTYYTVKQEALTSYMDSATVVGLHMRYQQHVHQATKIRK